MINHRSLYLNQRFQSAEWWWSICWQTKTQVIRECFMECDRRTTDNLDCYKWCEFHNCLCKIIKINIWYRTLCV